MTHMSEFDEYIVHGEPGQREKVDAWQTAIGLQYVDGLKVSDYLLDTALQLIKGDISIDDVQPRIKAYYETKLGYDAEDEEGDKASASIVKIVNEPSFAFSLIGLTSIHRRTFESVFKHTGKIRDEFGLAENFKQHSSARPYSLGDDLFSIAAEP